MYIFEIDSKKIGRLTDEQLTSLLNRLLILEAEAHAIPVNNIEVGLNIRTGDGGVDASIRWSSSLCSQTRFLPSSSVVFQCKAERMGPTKCADEVVSASGTLKPLVAAALDEGATYVLFTTDAANSKQKRERIAAMRKKLAELGNPHSASAQLHVWSCEDIARWTNAYLPAIVYVQAAAGFSIVPGLKTWTEWAATESPRWPFQAAPSLTHVIRDIRGTLGTPKSAMRLNGLPGLGKTRLVLEALSPFDGNAELAPRVVYYDAEYSQTELTKHVVEWVRTGLSGILVVDNCPSEVHRTLQREVCVPNSKLSLLTIFSNPSEDLRDTTKLVLKPCPDQELAGVVKEYTPGLQDHDANRIAHLSGGFIFFAYLLCDAYIKRQGLDDVLVTPDELLRFLWGPDAIPDDDALRTIQACSIFESVDFNHGETGEAEAVISISGVESAQFYRYVQGFGRRGIIERTGRYIRVRPHPLALRLCRNWWEGVSPSLALKVFDSVPESMVDALCERLRMLDTMAEAREVTAKLCGATAPFGQAEVLFSARGARIFRALAEVNPESASESLHSIILATSLSDLREDRTPRREWMWALTKLVFHRQTYRAAAEVLTRLALAENENFSNNATGTLVQTFQVALPGTEATLSERADLLERLFDTEGLPTVQLAVAAADRALQAEFFTRTGGGEDQGSGPPLVDYEPASFDEIHCYWRRVLVMMAESVAKSRCPKELAAPVLAGRIRTFVRAGADDLAKMVIETARNWGMQPWEAGIDAVKDALRYDIGDADDARVEMAKAWIEDLLPQSGDIAGQLAVYVSRPGWTDVAETAGADAPSPQLKVKELAGRCANDFARWAPYLTSLFRGEQRLGFVFGEYLARNLKERDEFVQVALKALNSDSEAPPNLSALCGFAHAVSLVEPSWTIGLVERFLSTPDIQRYSVEILANVSPDLDTLMRLVGLAADGNVDVRALERLSFGQALSHLTPKEVSRLVEALSALSEEAAWVALEIGYMSFFGRVEAMWPGLRDALRALLMSGRLALVKDHRGRDMHTWQETVLKLLGVPDDDFAIAISTQLVSAAANGVSSFDLPEKVATTLLTSHAAAAWPVFAAALLGEDAVQSWNLSGFLGRGLRGSATDGGFPLAGLDDDVLENWLHANAGAAERAARMLQLVSMNEDEMEWTRLGRLFIDEYGDNERVLSSVSSNLMSGVSWGPRTPFWQSLVRILSEFDNHRFKSVRDWVRSFKKSLTANIAAEQREADARSVGRW